MTKTKQFITEFLKETGATEETITKFEEMYDNDIQEAMQQEAQGNLYQSREEVSQGLQAIATAAGKHNIRDKRTFEGGSVEDMAARHNIRNK